MGLKLRFEKPFVRDNTDRVTKAEADISLNASEIAMRVTQQTFNALQGRVEDAESSLVLQANQIASKVSQTDFNGNTVASLINQTATTIKLKASKIELEGLVTANNNFKVLPDGSIEAVNAKLSGSITATKMVAPNGEDYYGEIGVTSGLVGFGLFDKRYGSEAFFEVLETTGGNGFSIRDKNNRTRIEVTQEVSRITSPNGNIRLNVTDAYVNIIKNGVVIGNWG